LPSIALCPEQGFKELDKVLSDQAKEHAEQQEAEQLAQR
jgi:hypothetical protein